MPEQQFEWYLKSILIKEYVYPGWNRRSPDGSLQPISGWRLTLHRILWGFTQLTYNPPSKNLAKRGVHMSPQRIQLRRTAGWRKPPNAIVVARPTKWGNPFAVGESITRDSPLWPYLLQTLPGDNARLPWSNLTIHDRQIAVDAYGWWFIEQPPLMLSLNEIRGRDLCCWCPVSQPCHADFLLELANEEGQ